MKCYQNNSYIPQNCFRWKWQKHNSNYFKHKKERIGSCNWAVTAGTAGSRSGSDVPRSVSPSLHTALAFFSDKDASAHNWRAPGSSALTSSSLCKIPARNKVTTKAKHSPLLQSFQGGTSLACLVVTSLKERWRWWCPMTVPPWVEHTPPGKSVGSSEFPKYALDSREKAKSYLLYFLCPS